MNERDLARLYEDYGYSVYRRCLTYLGDPNRAQDAVQEVFLRAFRGATGFRHQASPRTWLCRIADNHCIDLLRRDRRSPLVSAPAAGADGVVPELDNAVTPDADDARVQLQALMGRLDPAARRLAVLLFIDELTQEEIASELGLSRRTVGKRVQALRKKAGRILGKKVEA